MNKWLVLIIGFILLLIVSFIAFGIWWWFIRKPDMTPNKCVATQKGTTCLSNGYLAAIEHTQDDSMPTPLTSLKLDNFDAGQGYPPWCIPSFYAFRYVDQEGNYGDLSSWFGPVIAQPTANPGGCSANLPNLIVASQVDPNLGKYYGNVHRQDSILNENDDGKIVGMLSPVVYEFVDDPNTNPNINGGLSTCKNC